MNPIFLSLLAKRRAEKKGVSDSSEKNKIMLYPLILKDPLSGLITSDIATQKAVETTTVEQLKRQNQELATNAKDLAGVVGSIWVQLEALKKQLENDKGHHDKSDVKTYCDFLLTGNEKWKALFELLQTEKTPEQQFDPQKAKEILRKNKVFSADHLQEVGAKRPQLPLLQ